MNTVTWVKDKNGTQVKQIPAELAMKSKLMYMVVWSGMGEESLSLQTECKCTSKCTDGFGTIFLFVFAFAFCLFVCF